MAIELEQFQKGDLVIYENKLYRIVSIHWANSQLIDPTIYGIVEEKHCQPLYMGYVLPTYVRGALLVKSKAMEVLYGE